MNEYREHWAGHLRLTILRVLAELPGYKTNSSLLRDAADAHGIAATRDQVRTELSWLSEQGLVTTQTLDERLIVATATERGLDVAAGRATVHGVQRPSPRP